MHALLVAGARPNFMKAAPVLRSFDAGGIETTLVHTGQHYDAHMSDVFFAELGIRPPDVHLGGGSGSHAEQTARVMTAFEPVVAETRPDVVVVLGDINSTVACGLVAAKAGVFLAHVEAGLRSRDWTMPEEVNRVVTDRLSDLLLAPSADAVDNLRAEGYRDDQIHLVGNVMVDSLLHHLPAARERPLLEELQLDAGGFGLVTLHRPSNVDDLELLNGILTGLGAIAQRLPLVFPAHPRTRASLDQLTVPPGITLTEPVGYLDSIALQDGAAMVITDSGGIQEESTVLGTACLTVRDNTERPITVTEGSNQLVGTDPERLVSAAEELLDTGRSEWPRPALWDGKAADRITRVLLDELVEDRPRPTDLVSG